MSKGLEEAQLARRARKQLQRRKGCALIYVSTRVLLMLSQPQVAQVLALARVRARIVSSLLLSQVVRVGQGRPTLIALMMTCWLKYHAYAYVDPTKWSANIPSQGNVGVEEKGGRIAD